MTSQHRPQPGDFRDFIASDGVRLWTERRGFGQRLLVLTGTTGDLRRPPTPFDTPLGAQFELATFDQRGLGRSDKPPGPYTVADYAVDAATVLDALGWDQAHVMGISFGGMVAQELALRWSERVRRLVLCCSSPGGAGGRSYPLHELSQLSPDERARRMVGLNDLRCDAAWVAAHAEEHDQMVLASVAQPFGDEPGAAAGRLAQLAARAGHDTWDRIGDLRAETLICAGRYDGIAPMAIQMAMARRMPFAALRAYEGGHLFLKQDPRAYTDIAAFLDGRPAR